jgi:hypothetical protein
VNPEPITMKMVKDDRELAINLFTSLLILGVTYYAVNPGAADRFNDWIDRKRDAFIHRLSVWYAQQSIRALPETHERM